MGFQFTNNWPYTNSVMPSLIDHVDPVNQTFFDGLKNELTNIEYFLGLQPQGSYANVRSRLDYFETTFGKKFASCVVSPSGANADYSSIQDAINYVGALGGGIIYLREGTYYLTAALTNTSYSKILFFGSGKNTIITSNSALTLLIDFNFASGSGSHLFFEHITFDGNSGLAGTNRLVYIRNFDYVTFNNCYFKNCNGSGLRAENGSYFLTNNCRFDTIVAYAVEYTSSMTYAIITNSRFVSASSGFNSVIFDGNYCTLADCIFLTCYQGPYSSGLYNTVRNCTFQSMTHQPVTNAGYHFTCISNNFLGIYANSIQTTGLYSYIANNRFIGCTYIPILCNANYSIIFNNFIDGSGTYAISISGASISVLNNRIVSSASHAIYVDHCNLCNVNNNFINSSADSGIYIYYSSDISISSNVVRNCTHQGIYLRASSTCSLSSNIVRDNCTAGTNYSEIYLYTVGVDYCYYNNICGNVIKTILGDYCLAENNSDSKFNVHVSNTLIGGTLGSYSLFGTDDIIEHNMLKR